MSADKLIFIDVETTGIATNAGLIQLAGVIDIAGQPKKYFDYLIRPFADDTISDDALAVTGSTREQLMHYPEPMEVYQKFIRLLEQHVDKYNRNDKFHFIGYNARFDADHLRAWFKKNGDKYYGSWFYFPPIDVMNLAAVSLMHERSKLPDFKLTTVAKVCGLDFDPAGAHDALFDIKLTERLFWKVQRSLKNVQSIRGEVT